MDDYNALSDDEFRSVVRKFLAENYPPEIRDPPRRLHLADVREWYRRQSQAGWLAPGWPREYGGMGLSASKQIALMEEFERYGVARMPDHGIIMVGPLLIRYGTEEQKAYYLPKILSGEHIWCQGYSEPNAGSDLASLRTEALLDDDEWVINGQKTWTTLATDANWIFVLARTNRNAKKQEGISFLLVPLDSPGVTVRPIINLEMHDEFCETFFDNVPCAKSQLRRRGEQGLDDGQGAARFRAHLHRLAQAVVVRACPFAPARRAHRCSGRRRVPGPLSTPAAGPRRSPCAV